MFMLWSYNDFCFFYWVCDCDFVDCYRVVWYLVRVGIGKFVCGNNGICWSNEFVGLGNFFGVLKFNMF